MLTPRRPRRDERTPSQDRLVRPVPDAWPPVRPRV